ncbi:helix-turn-helix domain-containing protein [Aurantibacillus circumpalustris]|uniref:helix-turn-helix domain-containing protein n=1 Tax=Aurantibacillus circumpalustris TaxID=3036359 RepID=UPI00295AB632|nr:helix-turn-helix domain-containing protein [Aurantibacillus circumpalustris]
MESLGEIIRKLREERKMPLRVVAAYLEIDQAILSKIERGQRNATRENVVKLAKYFKVQESDLLVSWLSDKLVNTLEDEHMALKVLQVAEEKIEYINFKKIDRNELLKKIKTAIKGFKHIQKAWIYGSFARADDGPKSDVDIALQTDKTFSYFDLAEVKHLLESKLNRKVDVGFIDSFKPYILKNVEPDLKLVYER